MSAVIEARATYKDLFEKKHGVRLGFMGFFTKAVALAARDVPAVNAKIEGDEIVYHNYLDVSVAVSAPNGLVVPVVRNADAMSFAQIEKAIGDFGAKAKAGTLTMDDMSGGTFTISNGGTYGSLLSTPILNPPQSGILGMHKIMDRPVAINGKVEIRPMMYLALSYDHRIIDGKEAVTFLVTLKDLLENPTKLGLDFA
jgi:2-oxoglutarate dehydrogenase E2 component (dihydrolipoamide succinyltransferase)